MARYLGPVLTPAELSFALRARAAAEAVLRARAPVAWENCRLVAAAAAAEAAAAEAEVTAGSVARAAAASAAAAAAAAAKTPGHVSSTVWWQPQSPGGPIVADNAAYTAAYALFPAALFAPSGSGNGPLAAGLSNTFVGALSAARRAWEAQGIAGARAGAAAAVAAAEAAQARLPSRFVNASAGGKSNNSSGITDYKNKNKVIANIKGKNNNSASYEVIPTLRYWARIPAVVVPGSGDDAINAHTGSTLGSGTPRSATHGLLPSSAGIGIGAGSNAGASSALKQQPAQGTCIAVGLENHPAAYLYSELHRVTNINANNTTTGGRNAGNAALLQASSGSMPSLLDGPSNAGGIGGSSGVAAARAFNRMASRHNLIMNTSGANNNANAGDGNFSSIAQYDNDTSAVAAAAEAAAQSLESASALIDRREGDRVARLNFLSSLSPALARWVNRFALPVTTASVFHEVTATATPAAAAAKARATAFPTASAVNSHLKDLDTGAAATATAAARGPVRSGVTLRELLAGAGTGHYSRARYLQAMRSAGASSEAVDYAAAILPVEDPLFCPQSNSSGSGGFLAAAASNNIISNLDEFPPVYFPWTCPSCSRLVTPAALTSHSIRLQTGPVARGAQCQCGARPPPAALSPLPVGYCCSRCTAFSIGNGDRKAWGGSLANSANNNRNSNNANELVEAVGAPLMNKANHVLALTACREVIEVLTTTRNARESIERGNAKALVNKALTADNTSGKAGKKPAGNNGNDADEEDGPSGGAKSSTATAIEEPDALAVTTVGAAQIRTALARAANGTAANTVALAALEKELISRLVLDLVLSPQQLALSYYATPNDSGLGESTYYVRRKFKQKQNNEMK